MLGSREVFEAALLAATSAHVAIKLFAAESKGTALGSAGLLGLTLLAIGQEFLIGRGISSSGGYETKKAASQGIALGGLTLPWTFGALWVSVATTSGSSVFASYAFRSAAASSAAMLTFLLLKLSASGSMVSAGGSVGKAKLQARASWDGWRTTVGSLYVLLASTVLYSCIPETKGNDRGGQPVAAAIPGCLVLNALGSGVGLHLLLTHLPRSFTLGEAMVVAQTITLLLTDVASMAASCIHHCLRGWPLLKDGAVLLQTPLGERDATHVFVEVLLVAVAGTCMVVARLFASMRRIRKLGRERRGEGKAVEAAHFKGNAAKGLAGTVLNARTILTADSSSRAKAVPDVKGGRPTRLPAWAVEYSDILRQATALLLVAAVAIAAALPPAVWVLGFALASPRRLALLGYWVVLLAGALPLMDWVSRQSGMQTILVRKGYHLLALMLFSPALVLEPQLLAVSLAIACALLLVVEAMRVTRVPWLGPRIHSFMTSFIDERDSGLLLVSHFSLLVGMAAPVWVCMAGERGAPLNMAAAFAGITVLGIADSAASALGRRFGRHKILGTGKTLEGSMGGIGCNVVFWWLLSPWLGRGQTLGGFVYVSVASCALEAATTQLDNIFLPLHHLTLLLLL